MKRSRLFWLALFLSFVQPCIAAQPAGSVVMLAGRATAVDPSGAVRNLEKGTPVFAGDMISSGKGSYVNLRFADGAFFLLRPETRFQIEVFNFPKTEEKIDTPAEKKNDAAPLNQLPALTTATAASSSETKGFFRLLKGGFRSVSGLIGKANPDDYRVTTPVATIGIRGTSYGIRICAVSSCDDAEAIRSAIKKAAGNEGLQGLNSLADNLNGKGSGGSEEVFIISTVENGVIEIKTSQGVLRQEACAGGATSCGAVYTTNDGRIIPLDLRLETEQSERSLNPAACS